MGQLRGQLVAAQARAPDKQRTSVRKSQSRPLLPPLADVAVANRCRGATQQKRRAACHSTTEGFVGKCSDAGQPWSRGACADAARLTTTIPSRALRAGRYARISRRHHATHDPLGAKSRTRRPPETEQRSKTPICSGPNPPPPSYGLPYAGAPSANRPGLQRTTGLSKSSAVRPAEVQRGPGCHQLFVPCRPAQSIRARAHKAFPRPLSMALLLSSFTPLPLPCDTP